MTAAQPKRATFSLRSRLRAAPHVGTPWAVAFGLAGPAAALVVTAAAAPSEAGHPAHRYPNPLAHRSWLPLVVARGAPPGQDRLPGPPSATATATPTASPQPSPTHTPLPTGTPTATHTPGPSLSKYAGCIVREEFDDFEDGELDAIVTTRYTAWGEPLRVERDEDANGRLDSIGHYIYDQAGRLLRVEGDGNADGRVDGMRVFTYDEAGRLVRQVDYAGTGRPAVTSFEYDQQGNLIRRLLDEVGDGRPEIIERYQYDQSSRRIRRDYTNYPFEIDDFELYYWEDELWTRADFYWEEGGPVRGREVMTYGDDRQLERTDYYHEYRDELIVGMYWLYRYEEHGWHAGRDVYYGSSLEKADYWQYDDAGRATSWRWHDHTGDRKLRRYVNDCPTPHLPYSTATPYRPRPLP